MAVQVTLEFTDAQWALVQAHYTLYELNEVNADEKVDVTVDSLSSWLVKLVKYEVQTCVQRAARAEADKTTQDCFDV